MFCNKGTRITPISKSLKAPFESNRKKEICVSNLKNLFTIKHQLRVILKQLIRNPESDLNKTWLSTVKKQYQFVSNLKLGNPILYKSFETILSSIHRLVNSILTIIYDRYFLGLRVESLLSFGTDVTIDPNDKMLDIDFLPLKESLDFNQLKNQLTDVPTKIFNSRPNYKAESEKTKDSRKRLSEEVLVILNDWYFSHKDNPYLDRGSLRYLVGKTGLTNSQVKNWASNKRRKEKSQRNSISFEIIDLLESTPEHA